MVGVHHSKLERAAGLSLTFRRFVRSGGAARDTRPEQIIRSNLPFRPQHKQRVRARAADTSYLSCTLPARQDPQIPDGHRERPRIESCARGFQRRDPGPVLPDADNSCVNKDGRAEASTAVVVVGTTLEKRPLLPGY